MKSSPHFHSFTTEQLLLLAIAETPRRRWEFAASLAREQLVIEKIELHHGAIHLSGDVHSNDWRWCGVAWMFPRGWLIPPKPVFLPWAAIVEMRPGKRGNSLLCTLTSFTCPDMLLISPEGILERATKTQQLRGFAQARGRELYLSASILRNCIPLTCKPEITGIRLDKEIELVCEGEAIPQNPVDAVGEQA